MKKKLTELYDFFPNDFEWTRNLKDFLTYPSDSNISAYFTIDDIRFEIYITKEYFKTTIKNSIRKVLNDRGAKRALTDGVFLFDFMFKGPQGYDVSNQGHAGEVFSTMVHTFRKMVKILNSEENEKIFYLVQFDAVPSVFSRVKIYDAFATKIDKFVPGLSFVFSGKGHMYYWFVGREKDAKYFDSINANITTSIKIQSSFKKEFEAKNWDGLIIIVDKIFTLPPKQIWLLLDTFRNGSIVGGLDRSALTFVTYFIKKIVSLGKEDFNKNNGGALINSMLNRTGMSIEILHSLKDVLGDGSWSVDEMSYILKLTPIENRLQITKYLIDSFVITENVNKLSYFYKYSKEFLTEEELSYIESIGFIEAKIDIALLNAGKAVESEDIESFKKAITIVSDIDFISEYYQDTKDKIFDIVTSITKKNNPEMIHFFYNTMLASFGRDHFIGFCDSNYYLINIYTMRWLKNKDFTEFFCDRYLLSHYPSISQVENKIETILKVFTIEDIDYFLKTMIDRDKLYSDDMKYLEEHGYPAIKSKRLYKDLRYYAHTDVPPDFNEFKSIADEYFSITPKEDLGLLINLISSFLMRKQAPEYGIYILDKLNTYNDKAITDATLAEAFSSSSVWQTSLIFKWITNNKIDISSPELRRDIVYYFGNIPINESFEKEIRLNFLKYILEVFPSDDIFTMYKRHRRGLTPEELEVLESSTSIEHIMFYKHQARVARAYNNKDFESFKKEFDELLQLVKNTEDSIERKSYSDDLLDNMIFSQHVPGIPDDTPFLKYIMEKRFTVLQEPVSLYINYHVRFRTAIFSYSTLFLWFLTSGIEVGEQVMESFTKLIAKKFYDSNELDPNLYVTILLRSGTETIINRFVVEIVSLTYNYGMGEELEKSSTIFLALYNSPKVYIVHKVKIIVLFVKYRKMDIALKLAPGLSSLTTTDDSTARALAGTIRSMQSYTDNLEIMKNYYYFLFKYSSEEVQELVFNSSEFLDTPKGKLSVKILLDYALQETFFSAAKVLTKEYLEINRNPNTKNSLFKTIVKKAIALSDGKRTVNLETLLYLIPLFFKEIPLFGDFEKKFRSVTSGLKYPKELLKALITNKNISVEQLDNKARVELGLPIVQAPRRVNSPQQPVSQVAPLTQQEKLKELLDYEATDLKWSIPLYQFMSTSLKDFSTLVTQKQRYKIRFIFLKLLKKVIKYRTIKIILISFDLMSMNLSLQTI